MRLDELIGVVDDVHSHTSNNELVKAYAALTQQIQHLRSNPKADRGEHIEIAVRGIAQIQSQLDSTTWPPRRRTLFEALDPKHVLGERGTTRIKDILQRNFGSPNAAHTDVQKEQAEVQQVTELIRRLHDGLAPVKAALPSPPRLDGRRVLALHFAGQSGIAQLSDFAAQAKRWKLILAAFAQLTGHSEADPPVHRVQEGSIEIELAVLAENWAPMLQAWKALLEGLKFVRGIVQAVSSGARDKRDAEVMKIEAETRRTDAEAVREHAEAERSRAEASERTAKARLANAEAEAKERELERPEAAIENEATRILERSVEALVEDLITKHASKGTVDGDTRTLLRKALWDIIKFRSQGGTIAFRQVEEADETSRLLAISAQELDDELGVLEAQVERVALPSAGSDGTADPPEAGAED